MRIPAVLTYFLQVSPNTIALLKRALGNLSVPGQNRIGPAKINDHVAAFKTLNNPVNNRTFTITKHLVNDFPLGITHSMDDDLFGRLSGNSAKIGDIVQLFAEIVIKFNLRIELPGVLEIDFRFLVKDLFHHRTVLKNLNLAKLFIKLDFYIPPAAVFFSDRRTDSFLYGIDQQRFVDSLVPANLIENSF